jgi:hypothetical protein
MAARPLPVSLGIPLVNDDAGFLAARCAQEAQGGHRRGRGLASPILPARTDEASGSRHFGRGGDSETGRLELGMQKLPRSGREC